MSATAPQVLLMLSGSIAAYKACTVISRLVQAGVEVQCAATPAALRFIGRATLEGLSGRPVFCDLWEEGRALDHIALARAADLALVCPATANTINRLAAGLADDALGTLFLAWEREKPWWIAPAMNPHMWQHPSTTAALEKLRGWGLRIIEPADGPHACGDSGVGRLADPEQIAAEVLHALRQRAGQAGGNALRQAHGSPASGHTATPPKPVE
ncbi:flavoprotein [Cephaloticoccus primus]|uniref:flavoprotein n=1 Tax=Cephaloticoccus primus TaxID=1548207 RepID=UPI0008394484|nr:flavoprotein [Cephaloticoccus primus]